MISVNCEDVLPIQHQLLVYVADNVGAIPAVKNNEFILSPIEHDEILENSQVTKSIRDYLDSIGEGNNFTVTDNSKTVFIKSINGKKINKIAPPVRSIRTCCGV